MKPSSRSSARIPAASAPSASRGKRGRHSTGEDTFATPSPAAASAPAQRCITVKRSKSMFTEVDCTKSILHNLPEDIIKQIFFSGYFNSVDISKRLVTVCKDLYSISKKSVRAADMRNLSIGSVSMSRVLKNTFSNLCFLDMGYCDISDGVVKIISSSLSTSLTGLSLRGTPVTNVAIEYVSSVENLRYLDISKSSVSQKELIDDEGVAGLVTLKKLELLNVAGTDVTDSSLLPCLEAMTNLKHLSVQCCDVSLALGEVISSRSLITLDITGTNAEASFLHAIIKLKSPCARSLETLSCSHLTSFSRVDPINIILTNCPKISQLDMRGVFRTDEHKLQKDVLRGLLNLAIFEAHEQPNSGDHKIFKGIDYYFSAQYSKSR